MPITSPSGLRTFLSQGIKFATSNAASFAVGLRLTANPDSDIYFNVPNAHPPSTQAVVCDSSGNLSFQALGGGGTVTSHTIAAPSIFSITNPTVTTSGTTTLSLVSQIANTVFAAPNGSNGSPTFRGLVATDISNFDTQVRTSRLDQMAVPTSNLNLNSFKVTNSTDATNNQDLATWGQVQALFNGSDNKTSVRVSTTGVLGITSFTATTITKTGGLPTTLDGVTLAVGNRVLVRHETTTNAPANGIYLYSTGNTWTRATDADIDAEVTSGLFTFVEEGTANGSNGYSLNTSGVITLGTTNLSFIQTSGLGQIIDGAGLIKTGNQLDIGAGTGITVNADSIQISSSYVGQTSITTLGTITTGVWNGTPIALANGGTGATTAAAARTNLGTLGVFRTTFTNASLVSGVLTVTHNLGNRVVLVQISDNNGKTIPITDDVTLVNTTSCAVDLTSFGTLVGTWDVIVSG